MNIDRHNYEEFFILYMDNELSPEERRSVEAFITMHPDLKDELELLSQFKLEPDTSVVFNGKEELIKVNGETPISLSNYEEWMVLYNDSELNTGQQLLFEQFMIAHPALHQEFQQLKRARLEPGTIVFPGKAFLYRKEEKVRRLPVWWRFAAAAILLLAIGITATIVISNNGLEKKGDIVKDESPAIKTDTKIPVINNPVPNQENIVVNNDREEKVVPVVLPTKQNNIAVTQRTPLRKEKMQAIIPDQDPKEMAVTSPKTNDLPKPLNNPNNIAHNKINTDIASHIPSEYTQPKNSLTKQDVTSADPNSSNIRTAVYPEPDPTIEQPDGKKNKSRGLFRKIARTFEKRTSMDPTDDNRLLVAGLAIKLK